MNFLPQFKNLQMYLKLLRNKRDCRWRIANRRILTWLWYKRQYEEQR